MEKVVNARVAVSAGARNYKDPVSVGSAVQRCLGLLDLPPDFVRPGDKVVLKPNWVKEHDERHPGPGCWEHVITHPTVIEAVVRWVARHLGSQGSIVICDAPQTDSSFSAIRKYCGLDQMLERCRQTFPRIAIDVLDLRPEEWRAIDGVTVARRILPGDPMGSTHIQLGSASEFVGFGRDGQLYGASFDMAETNVRHRGDCHEYLLCRTPMDADVFINLPKLKTHKKVGITCSLKNLVGINANKNWLPHHTEGTPQNGGDQFPVGTSKARWESAMMGTAKRWVRARPGWSRLLVPLKKAGRLYFGDTQKVIRSGNWHGNQTCWRMVLDLNKCFFFFGGTGERRTSARRYLSIVDGIIAGEGNGPMSPDPIAAGVILAGTHPLAVDVVGATLMGFDWRKLSLLTGAFAVRELNFVSFRSDDIHVVSENPSWNGPVDEIKDVFHFRPHFGWRGAIEKTDLVRDES